MISHVQKNYCYVRKQYLLKHEIIKTPHNQHQLPSHFTPHKQTRTRLQSVELVTKLCSRTSEAQMECVLFTLNNV